jgi:hypothetical protein
MESPAGKRLASIRRYIERRDSRRRWPRVREGAPRQPGAPGVYAPLRERERRQERSGGKLGPDLCRMHAGVLSRARCNLRGAWWLLVRQYSRLFVPRGDGNHDIAARRARRVGLLAGDSKGRLVVCPALDRGWALTRRHHLRRVHPRIGRHLRRVTYGPSFSLFCMPAACEPPPAPLPDSLRHDKAAGAPTRWDEPHDERDATGRRLRSPRAKMFPVARLRAAMLRTEANDCHLVPRKTVPARGSPSTRRPSSKIRSPHSSCPRSRSKYPPNASRPAAAHHAGCSVTPNRTATVDAAADAAAIPLAQET